MKSLQRSYSSILVGGGPAAIAVLLSAHRDGKLRELLRRGLLIVERSPQVGRGEIGGYAINSDSTGNTFVDPLHTSGEPALHRILQTGVARRIAAAGQGAVPLQDVGELMSLIGEAMRTIMAEFPQCAVLTSSTAEFAQALPNGQWRLTVKDDRGRGRQFVTANLILATGAAQPASRLVREKLSGVPVAARWGSRLMQSGDVLSQGGLVRVAQRLRGRSAPRVAILGGSTSAMAVAHALLNRMPDISFCPGSVTLFHRRPLRVYYTSAAEAVSDGYNDFDADDLCPVTKRLYRFAGLRLDSRELLMQVRGLGGRSPEPRMHLHQLTGDDPEAIRSIDAADVVVGAFGYRPNGLRLLDEAGQAIPLFANSGPSATLVDERCSVLDGNARPIAGVFGIGLAAGYRPRGKFGGEPSFAGQVNGLWVWQSGVGSIIANQILEDGPPLEAPRVRSARTPVRRHFANLLAVQGAA